MGAGGRQPRRAEESETRSEFRRHHRPGQPKATLGLQIGRRQDDGQSRQHGSHHYPSPDSHAPAPSSIIAPAHPTPASEPGTSSGISRRSQVNKGTATSTRPSSPVTPKPPDRGCTPP